MSAQVEDRHREAAMTALNSATREKHGEWHPEVAAVARLLAGTEAAERDRSAALRAEFEACVRALRKIENTGPFHMADKEFVDAALLTARAALSGPLAREVADA